MPPDWLEKLLAPFVRPEVTIVSGNVLPLESQSLGSQLFENYGGLGRGNAPFEVNQKWFDAFRFRTVPTWELGGTANAAFRAAPFRNPLMGMMDETLGPGMPTGVGEDTYLFYRWLKAGATLVYQPSAYVWHKHRQDLRALQRQIYNYSKGHVAYHLTTLFRDRDLRVVPRLLVSLPLTHAARFLRRLSHPAQHQMLVLTVIEIAGNLVGPWSLWQAHRVVRRNRKNVRVAAEATLATPARSLGRETL
jgi:cellulose synthase/poly-beta-1,6-N-acetylglucosamine synthase-like glycosyltransferase